jgi:hypothetical protein
MALRITLEPWRAALLASLGVLPVGACNGMVHETGDHSSDGAVADSPSVTLLFPCTNPMGQNGGFIACDGGWKHRASRSACPVPPDATTCGAGSQCTKASDCPPSEGTRVTQAIICAANSEGVCYCSYGCTTDSGCQGAYPAVCTCGDVAGSAGQESGVCEIVNCRSDAECAGYLCATAMVPPTSGCPSETYACQTARDECMTDADCPGGQSCLLEGSGAGEEYHRVCKIGGCVTGRPFIVAGGYRVATVEDRSEWTEFEQVACVESLTERERAELCDWWTRIALMEHASIASFARFTLVLLSMGAPSELVEASVRAASDEAAHARAAFGLASTYGARALGPGELDVRGSLDEIGAESTVECVIAEGCLGETIAAAEAAEALERATDPAGRAVLARIRDDERRHAELAWQFVRWALQRGSTELRLAARAGLADLVARPDSGAPVAEQAAEVPGSESEKALLRHGRLPAALRDEVAGRVVRDVVTPCALALLGRGSVEKAA